MSRNQSEEDWVISRLESQSCPGGIWEDQALDQYKIGELHFWFCFKSVLSKVPKWCQVCSSVAAPGAQQKQMQNSREYNRELGKECMVSEDCFSSFKLLNPITCLYWGRKAQLMQTPFKEEIPPLCISFSDICITFWKPLI